MLDMPLPQIVSSVALRVAGGVLAKRREKERVRALAKVQRKRDRRERDFDVVKVYIEEVCTKPHTVDELEWMHGEAIAGLYYCLQGGVFKPGQAPDPWPMEFIIRYRARLMAWRFKLEKLIVTQGGRIPSWPGFPGVQ
jgi:hypothetical protein